MAFPAGTSRTNLYFDIPWEPGHAIASEADLQKSLRHNPVIQSLNITLQARWFKKPGSITGTHASAVITFEDPDGTIERNLIKSRIFAFGELVTLKKWHSRPPNLSA